VAIQIKMLPLLAKAAKNKGGKKAEESLDCFPPRFARGRNDGDRNRLFQQPARAIPAKIESPEALYLFVLSQFLTRNRFPLSLELL